MFTWHEFRFNGERIRDTTHTGNEESGPANLGPRRGGRKRE
jgi:hypothetical protein